MSLAFNTQQPVKFLPFSQSGAMFDTLRSNYICLLAIYSHCSHRHRIWAM